jgi:hypothetical protein
MAPIASQLTPLQMVILDRLAAMEPRWTLAGGAALAGVYLGHRTTRDIDLSWRGQKVLGDLARIVEDRLVASGLAVRVIQREATFARLLVANGVESIVVDLVADPGPFIEADEHVLLGTAEIRITSRHEILVNKLCTLLGRVEIRDLQDVRELIAAGGDLERALRDAPKIDSGFSPLTLAWVLRDLDPRRFVSVGLLGQPEADALTTFRDELIENILSLSRPE